MIPEFRAFMEMWGKRNSVHLWRCGESGIPCIYGDAGKAEFRNRRDLIPEFLGIPFIYGDVEKAEFRNRRDLIPECSTSRNRMYSHSHMVQFG